MNEIGINLYTLRNHISTEEGYLNTARELKKMGYTFLQHSGVPFAPEISKKINDEIGLPTVLTHVPFDRIVNDTEKLMEEHAFFNCRRIGIGAMPVNVTDEKVCKNAIDSLQLAAERMKNNGFTLFYHNHHLEFYRYSDGTVYDYIINNAPDIHFTVDTYWLQYGGVDIISTMEKVKGRMECVHLKDYKLTIPADKTGAWSMVPTIAAVGDGNIDFVSVVKKAKEFGATHFFVEQDNAESVGEGMDEVKKSVDYVIKHL